MLKTIERGFCIFATGHPLYGRAAYNLAMSLKAMGDVQICVLFNGRAMNHINEDQLEFFDHVIKLPDEIPHNTTCKMYVNEYSPFKKTILLDADMLWLPYKDPNELFELFQHTHFTGITEGKEDDLKTNPPYYFWADVAEIKEHYQLKGMIYQWRSEFLYFDEEGGKIIDRALEILGTHKLTSVKNFANHMPDELCINIATAEAGVQPHKFRWIPAYWPHMHGNRIPALKDLKDTYYMMSFGSHTSSNTLKGVYDIIMRHACNKFKKQHVFRLMDKKYNIPERNLM